MKGKRLGLLSSPISEVMKRSGLIVQEEKETVPTEDVVDAEVEPTTAEASTEDENDDDILSPSKPNHIGFGKSIITAEDMVLMKKLGYFGDNDDKLVRFAGEGVIPEPKDDEVVVFRSFFRAGLQFPLYEMLGEVLKKDRDLTSSTNPNTIVRLNVYIWALRS
jgi:hypothetical protein